MQYLTRTFSTLAFGALLVCGCKKETPPTPQDARAPMPVVEPETPPTTGSEGTPATALTPASAVASAPAPAAAEPQAGGSRLSEKNFDLALQPVGTYAAGQEAKVEIVLDAKPPFKVNQEYPYKFKLKESAGLKFKAPVVGKDAAKLEKQRVTMPVSFVPEAAGKHSVAGQFAFSVCTDENCLIEKRDLALVVDVK